MRADGPGERADHLRPPVPARHQQGLEQEGAGASPPRLQNTNNQGSVSGEGELKNSKFFSEDTNFISGRKVKTRTLLLIKNTKNCKIETEARILFYNNRIRTDSDPGVDYRHFGVDPVHSVADQKGNFFVEE